jgi:hypothetical protein
MSERPSKRRFLSRSDSARNSPSQVSLLQRAEWILAIVLSATVLFMLIARTTHAGALWRDECESVQWARMPRFADVLANFHYGSFPILFPTIVRTYTTLLGASDLSLRFFGLAVGIAFIGAAWFQSRSITGQVPLLLLALVGLNPNFLTAGTWVRGYGVGSVLIVLAFSLTAKFLLQPTTSRLWAVFLISLASMQCLFFNGALVPAIILAGTVVLLLHRRIKWTLLLLCIAGACATAYTPYLLKTYFREQGPWVHISKPVSPNFGQQLQQELAEACGVPISVMPWIWLGIVLLSVGGATWRLSGIWGQKPASQRDMLLFGVITICASIPLYYAFIRFVHRPPQARYYLAIFCLVASAADLLVANLYHLFWLRFSRFATVLVVTLMLPYAAWPAVVERQTNIDIVAQKLEKDAGSNDVIVINWWSLGVSFNWYYHGSTRWMTLPEIREHRIHRYDLLRRKMAEPLPLEDVQQAVTTALQSGNRVWIVNRFNARSALSRQFGTFLQRHATKGRVIIPAQPAVSARETTLLWVAEGWDY